MDKDLLNEPYGRFYHLAKHLAESGHQVQLILLSYKLNENEEIQLPELYIRSFSLLPNPIYTLYKLYQLVKSSSPDWIFGYSDIYYGILAEYFSWKTDKKCLIDAYDNYESYFPLLKPLHWCWRLALKRADIVTCAGPSLKDLFSKYRKNLPIEILPMAVDGKEFFPKPRDQCRENLNLPQGKKLIGYHGSISNSRDISVLFDAVQHLNSQNPDIVLVLSGRLSLSVSLPAFAHYLGYIPDSKVPEFVNSMDVIAVPNSLSAFGEYSHPIKLYEAMACDVPLAATKTKSTKWILRDYPSSLAEAGNVAEFARCLDKALTMDRINYGKQADWLENTERLNALLLEGDNI